MIDPASLCYIRHFPFRKISSGKRRAFVSKSVTYNGSACKLDEKHWENGVIFGFMLCQDKHSVCLAIYVSKSALCSACL